MRLTLPPQKFPLPTAIALSAFCAVAEQAVAYVQTNLVSDIPGLAIVTDPELVNPWGVSHSGMSPAGAYEGRVLRPQKPLRYHPKLTER
jgi:hypothetical protein